MSCTEDLVTDFAERRASLVQRDRTKEGRLGALRERVPIAAVLCLRSTSGLCAGLDAAALHAVATKATLWHLDPVDVDGVGALSLTACGRLKVIDHGQVCRQSFRACCVGIVQTRHACKANDRDLLTRLCVELARLLDRRHLRAVGESDLKRGVAISCRRRLALFVDEPEPGRIKRFLPGQIGDAGR